MRILCVTPFYPNKFNSYAGIFVENLNKALINEGCNIDVITAKPYCPLILTGFKAKWKDEKNLPYEEMVNGIKVKRITIIRLPKNLMSNSLFYLDKYSLKLENSNLSNKYDLIVAHTLFSGGVWANELSKRLGIPYVVFAHGSDVNFYCENYKNIRKKCKQVIEESETTYGVSKYLTEKVNNLSECGKGKLHYIGIDSKQFVIIDKDKARNLTRLENKFTILYIGNLLESKGIKILLEAFLEVNKSYTDLQLVIVGDGALKPWITNFIEENRLKSVVLAGQQKHDEIPKYIGASDMVVLPSFNEGLSHVLIEAHMMAKPCIATKVGGIPEIVVQGKTGELIEPNNAPALASAIIKMREKVDLDSMGKLARETVLNKFELSNNTKKLVRDFEEIITKHKR